MVTVAGFLGQALGQGCKGCKGVVHGSEEGGTSTCLRIRGAKDNFIFNIEYCFFVPVMKLR